MSGPLEGTRVIDCSMWMQGPMTGAMLGDMGADVIKVEQRGRGDDMRGLDVWAAFPDVKLERNTMFETMNRNKRGIAIDVNKPLGQEVMHRLLQNCDILIHNFRSKAARKLKLDYETVAPLNHRLIYAQASGWGLKGPEKDRGAIDWTAAARTGLMYIVGDTEVPLPQPFTRTIVDANGAIMLLVGILAALQARERSGSGQMVDTSLFGSAITLASWPMTHALSSNSDPGRPGREGRNVLACWYKCSDDLWIYLTMTQGDRYWHDFCDIMGIRHLENDPRFASLKVRATNGRELVGILDKIFATRTRDEWLRLLQERDLVCGPIKKPTELAHDPQALENGYVLEWDNPVHGKEKVVGFPYNFSKTPASLRRPCPEFGQHTEEVLLDAGYTWDDIARFKTEEVI